MKKWISVKKKLMANDFDNAVKPIHDWLRENGHPHMIVVVDMEGAQAFERVASIPFAVSD